MTLQGYIYMDEQYVHHDHVHPSSTRSCHIHSPHPRSSLSIPTHLARPIRPRSSHSSPPLPAPPPPSPLPLSPPPSLSPPLPPPSPHPSPSPPSPPPPSP